MLPVMCEVTLFKQTNKNIKIHKSQNRSNLFAQFSNNIFNKRLTIGLGVRCLHIGGQNVASFLKANFRDTNAGKISPLFTHRFHNYARELLSEDTERSDRANRM